MIEVVEHRAGSHHYVRYSDGSMSNIFREGDSFYVETICKEGSGVSYYFTASPDSCQFQCAQIALKGHEGKQFEYIHLPTINNTVCLSTNRDVGYTLLHPTVRHCLTKLRRRYLQSDTKEFVTQLIHAWKDPHYQVVWESGRHREVTHDFGSE